MRWAIVALVACSQPTARDPRLADYCAAVSAALATDARDLDSGDPLRRDAAADRFAAMITYHSEPEIELCSKAPLDLRERDRCWLGRDYSCLARLARAAAEATR